ncbi:hypothetical protein [Streptomyces cellostaticus]|uniref:hypothetical protein n=1 Tax=Streptomyces TaxID=1883 RepID=UPI00202617AA|nr:hypothetical protein [Streptomyces cellostaticus]
MGAEFHAEAVLAVRGEHRTVVVSAVHEHAYESRNYSNYSCSVALPDGTPVAVEVWASCDASSREGDRFTMLFDPAGKVAPTDRRVPGSAFEPTALTAGGALALTAAFCIAVVRSRRGRSTVR